MTRTFFTMFLSVIASIYAINRPVFKIVLTQKGYAQFLQYDVETPPIREFTFCTWIRVYDVVNDQSIFTYIANGNNRVFRLWLDSGGKFMKISINGINTFKLHVDVVKDVWRHVCLSYQSDFGAWALYIDSRLISCEADHNLSGFVLPSGGSVIIGYGTTDNGFSNGLEGEIFGANMILISTIERNITMKSNPEYKQKLFQKNKVKKHKNMNYVILGDLVTDGIQNNFEISSLQPFLKKSPKSYVKFHTPYSDIEHSVGVDVTTTEPLIKKTPLSQEILDFTVTDFKTNKRNPSEFWNNDAQSNPRFTKKIEMHVTKQSTSKLSDSGVQVIPIVSEYETPPPPPSVFFDNTVAFGEQPTPTEFMYKLKNSTSESGKRNYRMHPVAEISDYETPPPVDKSTKIYGQWTSSKFAGTVLNYLKSINFKNRKQNMKKVPQTIPLYKTSDSHPYSSDFKYSLIRPPSHLFKNRKLIDKRYDIVKREPQINVKILEDDIRSRILRMHAETHPESVEITNRGISKREHRYSRNARYEKKSDEDLDDLHYPRPFTLVEDKKRKQRYFAELTSNKIRTSVLPFLKSLEYPMLDSGNIETQTVANSKDMYFKSLSHANKWHNVKSYSNDYTPRKIDMDSIETENDRKKHYPAIRLNYVHEKKITEKEGVDPSILKGQKFAADVLNHQSDLNLDSVSILEYNNRYLPASHEKTNMKNIFQPNRKRGPSKRNMNSFDKQVKIGNALNERNVIGNNEEQKKQSFVGGNDSVPDINRYRSDIDSEDTHVPPSLGPKVCKNAELYDRVLYVQKDESIDMTHILSPVREKNIGIEFVLQNYKKCSLTDSPFLNNALLLIDWSKTPVRLFGGSYPKTTTDLCGFF